MGNDIEDFTADRPVNLNPTTGLEEIHAAP